MGGVAYATRTETRLRLARISLNKTVRVFLLRIQTVNQAAPLFDVDDGVARFGVTPRFKGDN